MAGWAHLVRRLLGSLDPRPLGEPDERWARSHLLPGEVALWERMSRADRRHSVGVARAVVGYLGQEALRPVVAAALLHDVGKLDSGLGTSARVAATLVGRARGGSARAGDGRIARYLAHDRIGADLLTAAGSDPITVTWAREHHLPRRSWTLPEGVAAALHAADDE